MQFLNQSMQDSTSECRGLKFHSAAEADLTSLTFSPPIGESSATCAVSLMLSYWPEYMFISG